VNSQLADLFLSQGSSKVSLEEIVQTFSKNKSITTFRQWMDRCKKYIQIGCE
jgi:hypothetical protein